MRISSLVVLLLKIAPLGIFLRSAACKLDLPYLGCDAPLCVAAIGQVPDEPCTPTANTKELKAWCENVWAPHYTKHLKTNGIEYNVPCSDTDQFLLLKAIGAIELVAYLLLWVSPRLGAFILLCTMIGAIELHVNALGEKVETLFLQIGLAVACLLVLLLSGGSSPRRKAEATQTKAKTNKKRD